MHELRELRFKSEYRIVSYLETENACGNGLEMINTFKKRERCEGFEMSICTHSLAQTMRIGERPKNGKGEKESNPREEKMQVLTVIESIERGTQREVWKATGSCNVYTD